MARNWSTSGSSSPTLTSASPPTVTAIHSLRAGCRRAAPRKATIHTVPSGAISMSQIGPSVPGGWKVVQVTDAGTRVGAGVTVGALVRVTRGTRVGVALGCVGAAVGGAVAVIEGLATGIAGGGVAVPTGAPHPASTSRDRASPIPQRSRSIPPAMTPVSDPFILWQAAPGGLHALIIPQNLPGSWPLPGRTRRMDSTAG